MSPNVVMQSLWMNDANRWLEERIDHLLAKTGVTRWLWVVGDSSDETEAILRATAERDPRITVIRHDTGINPASADERLVKLSLTANAGIDAIRPDDDYFVLHESDLISPVNVVDGFLASGKDAIAGWVTLGKDGIFYDTYAYRRHGVKFNNEAPYHAVYRPDELFEVDSFGSCWMARADLVRGMKCERGGVIDICAEIKRRGGSLWVDPRIVIVQPTELWRSQSHASV